MAECAVIVYRPTGGTYRLNRKGTDIWRSLAASQAPPTVGQVRVLCGPEQRAAAVTAFLEGLVADGLLEPGVPPDSVDERDADESSLRSWFATWSGRPRCRRIEDMAEVVEPIEVSQAVLVKRVGGGFLMRAPDGTLSLLSGESAALWELLTSASCTFVELTDGLCDRFDLTYEDADRVATRFLLSLRKQHVAIGLEKLARFRRHRPSSGAPDVLPASGPARPLGRLERMEQRREWQRPCLGRAPAVWDGTESPDHVVVVCQYGISGFAAGVEPYVQRCVTRLRQLDPDLIILSGGGRHGLTTEREAESAVERYRAQLPWIPLWLEKYSGTTWENLQNSLEMLLARSILPSRVSVVGDRARAEKLRLACLLTKRRFSQFRDVSFDVIALSRQRSTWRDTRAIQLFVGCAQVLRNSRSARLAVSSDIA